MAGSLRGDSEQLAVTQAVTNTHVTGPQDERGHSVLVDRLAELFHVEIGARVHVQVNVVLVDEIHLGRRYVRVDAHGDTVEHEVREAGLAELHVNTLRLDRERLAGHTRRRVYARVERPVQIVDVLGGDDDSRVAAALGARPPHLHHGDEGERRGDSRHVRLPEGVRGAGQTPVRGRDRAVVDRAL